MKYIALLSGGKDSCFNLLHCQKNGHELVAAASLRPEQGKDEIDSYMYQTVGQDAIEIVAKALNTPLYRRVISGGAVHQCVEYGARTVQGVGDLKGDETEDLYELLATVLEHHPEVEGVSVGAILSNYQRVRVEHVCRRLNLTPLAYLWQRDQGDLLSEMIDIGLTAVLIKVAGIGLTVKHLGKTLEEMQPTLIKLNSLYGSHICGEGGEYETLTIESPMFASKIVLKEVGTVIHSDSDFATVAYLRINEAELAPKAPVTPPEVFMPPLLDEVYSNALKLITLAVPSISSLSLDSPKSATAFPMTSRKVQDWVAVANVQRTSHLTVDISIEKEVAECFQNLAGELKKYVLEIHHCANINIFLSSMDLFSRVNAVYGSFFGTSPPARACVSVSLPEPFRIRLDAIAYVESRPGDRQAHHVQGLSYWAPANIGPYSQAILAQEHVFVSGQIGLIPRNLVLAESLQLQTVLSCQHASRIVDAMASNTGSNWHGIPHFNIYWFESTNDLLLVKSIDQALKEEDVPSLFVAVTGLPKGAKVEKQTLVHTGRSPQADEGGDTEGMLVRKDTNELHRLGNTRVRYQTRILGAYVISLICLKGGLDFSSPDTNSKAGSLALYPQLLSGLTPSDKLHIPLSARLFYRPSRGSSDTIQSIALAVGLQDTPITEIPCNFISSGIEDDWDYAVCILSHLSVGKCGVH